MLDILVTKDLFHQVDICRGLSPTEIVPITVSVSESITDILSEPALTTYTLSQTICIELGRSPTVIVSITVSVEVSITETLSEPSFATYNFVPLRRENSGLDHTGIVLVTVSVRVFNTLTFPIVSAMYILSPTRTGADMFELILIGDKSVSVLVSNTCTPDVLVIK